MKDKAPKQICTMTTSRKSGAQISIPSSNSYLVHLVIQPLAIIMSNKIIVHSLTIAKIVAKMSRTKYSSPELENRMLDYNSMATDTTWKAMEARQ